MKRLLAGALTAVVLGLIAWSALRRPAVPAASSANPSASANEADNPAEARIHALLEDAWAGDVAAYLASFAGPYRDRLERLADERGRDRFADDLRRAARSRKSHAVFAAEADGEATARVTVETVYPDRNERQTYRVERGPEGWVVTEVETVRGHQPKAKYGTPAHYQEPEGPPVQRGGLAVETGDDPPVPEP